jgi:tetratricopeptide (TPR) repeat protein
MMGETCLRLGRSEEGRKYYEDAFRMRQEEIERGPDPFLAHHDLYLTHLRRGHLRLVHLDDPAAALDDYRQALAEIDRLSGQDPTNLDHKRDLALAHYCVGTASLEAGRKADADEHFARCLALRKELVRSPGAKLDQRDLMVALARCGQHKEAAAIADELLAVPPQDAQIYFQAALGYALAAGAAADDPAAARSYTDRAVTALRRGREHGWKDVVAVRTDPELDAIRGDPGFVALLEESERGAPAPEAADRTD